VALVVTVHLPATTVDMAAIAAATGVTGVPIPMAGTHTHGTNA
jgi:hypothetical protein